MVESIPPSKLTLPPIHPPTNRAPSSTLSTRSILSSGGPTPSMLTPNTRAEAEAALAANTAYQTDAAAPTTPLPPQPSASGGAGVVGGVDGSIHPPRPLDELSEEELRQTLGVRPPIPSRSSMNYFNALAARLGGESPVQSMPRSSTVVTGKLDAASSSSLTLGREKGRHEGEDEEEGKRGGPVGGGGVVVAGDDDSGGGGDWKPPIVERQQSWKEQDMRRMMQQRLMGKSADGDMGYDSAPDDRI